MTSLRHDIKCGTYQQSAKYKWLKIQMKNADASHVVFVWHHPVYSNGDNYHYSL